MDELILDCWLLDAADDHYIALWELFSLLQQKQPDANTEYILRQLSTRLSSLYEKDLIKMYKGYMYNGDEIEIMNAIDYDFLKEEITDSYDINSSKQVVKIYITDTGRNWYLSKCDKSMF